MSQHPTITEEDIKEEIKLTKPRRSRKKTTENTAAEAEQISSENSTQIKKSSRKKKVDVKVQSELPSAQEAAANSIEKQNIAEPEKKHRRSTRKTSSATNTANEKLSEEISGTTSSISATTPIETLINDPAPRPRRTRSRRSAAPMLVEKSKEAETSAVIPETEHSKTRHRRKTIPHDSSQEIIHLGSALILDDILPPSSSPLAQKNIDAETTHTSRTRRSRKTTSKSTTIEAPISPEQSSASSVPVQSVSTSAPLEINAVSPAQLHTESPVQNASEENKDYTIHLGSALVLDGILPPSSIEKQKHLDSSKEFKERNSRRQERRQKLLSKQAIGELGNQAITTATPVADDFGNRVESLSAGSQVWSEDDSIVTHILPYTGELGDDIRSHRRTHRNKKTRDAQPPFNGSPYLPVPYQKNFYDQQQELLTTPTFNNRKQRNNRRKTLRNPQAIPTLPDDFDFNAAMLNDSILGVALGRREDDFLPEDDGPQPALPDQPVALPISSGDMEEEDLAALDAAVNGNRIEVGILTNPKENKQSHRNKKGFKDERIKEDKNSAERNGSTDEAEAEETPNTRRVLYVSVVPDEQVEVVITEDGQVTEYFVEMAHQVKIRGNIYKGIINNIDTNLQAAFVNFGSGKNGFLQIDEVHPEYYLVPHDSSHNPKYPPIQKVLKVGQEVLVQVVKEPAGSKGAFLTTWISIAGRFLVLTPGQEQIGVSRKVEDPEERARLKDLLSGIQPGENMGVIIRTASEGASKNSIQQDLQYLKKLWKDIQKKAPSEKAPSLIYQEADLATRSVRDYLSEDIVEIWTDDENVKPRLEDIVRLIFPDRASELVKLHKDQRQSLWERFNLLRQLETVTSREVILPSGGRLVFDQTEALMAIDINSGKTQGKTNFEAMVFRTNMEAAEAIARHLRLRDIGGQVVIDFIEMRDKNHCREVERTIRNAMRRDRARHDVGHMSSFGLLELVRQRTGTSAISISCEPCPHCHGTGVRRNMEWQALRTLRDLQSKLCKSLDTSKKKNDQKQPDASTFIYECDGELAMYILNRKRDRLTALEEKFGIRIEVRLK